MDENFNNYSNNNSDNSEDNNGWENLYVKRPESSRVTDAEESADQTQESAKYTSLDFARDLARAAEQDAAQDSVEDTAAPQHQEESVYRYSYQRDHEEGPRGVYSGARHTSQYASRMPAPNPPKPPKKSGGFFWKVVAALLLGVIFGGAAGGTLLAIGYIGDFRSKYATDLDLGTSIQQDVTDKMASNIEAPSDSIPQIIQPIISDTTAVLDVSGVVEEVMPAVVSIAGNYTVTQQGFWGQIYERQVEGSGSGIILSNNGEQLLIATNNHVVEDSVELKVQFIDGTSAEARIKGTNPNMDLAVIIVDTKDLSADTKKNIAVAQLGDSDSIKVGEPAIAIGNALGYGQSVTTGVISALDRKISDENGRTSEGLIQTDAAINPGNSGGALLNMYGQVIGINSSKIGGTTIDGVGFAIPISLAEPILDDIVTSADRIKIPENKRGYLGIGGVSVTEEISDMYGMPVGVQVRQIYEGTGSADSEMEVGDIICKINNKEVESMEDLQEELTYYEKDTEVTITAQRFTNGEYKEITYSLVLTSKDKINTSSNR